MAKEYIIYCDESDTKGRLFSNFYGGALVDSDHIDEVRAAIAAKKQELHFFGEVKWNKISTNYHEKYIQLMDFFFDLIRDGKVKIRIMFTQNAMRAGSLKREHLDNQYAILYYYFIRHAFGLIHAPFAYDGTRVRLYPDSLPMNAESVKAFKRFILGLNDRREFRDNRVSFSKEDITEVVSHEHDILQCLDVVLGAMNFRLNQKHLEKPEGAKRRSAKTRAREKVYDHINRRIRGIYPNFNIGVTTGTHGDKSNRWRHECRHWNFKTGKKWK
jgi:hypothetical protein